MFGVGDRRGRQSPRTDGPASTVESDPHRAIDYMTRLFLDAESLPSRYDRDQIGRGLMHLINVNSSDYSRVLLTPSISQSTRLECVSSIAHVFRMFSSVCERYLASRSRPATPGWNEANGTCYMWWDVIVLHPGGRHVRGNMGVLHGVAEHDLEAIERACLEVMKQSLAIDHIACQESALHGLGHWHHGHPEEAMAIIDAFLASGRCSHQWLADYAMDARRGRVM